MQDLSTLSDEQLVRLRAAATGQTAPQTAPQPQAGPLRAPPRPVDQYRAADEQRANNADARAGADQALQEQAAQIARARFALEQEDRARRLAAGPIADAREGEANNASFLGRAESALAEYDRLERSLGGPRSMVGGFIADIPGGQTLLRALPDGVGDSPERRSAERAARDFAMNILRSDSGANAPEPEVDRLVSVFFPPAGETDPAVLEAYRQARRQAVEGLRTKAGRLGVDPAQAGNPPAQGSDPRAFMTPDDFETGYDRLSNPSPQNMPRLTAEQEASWAQFVRDNQGRMTPQLAEQWYAQNTDGWRADFSTPEARQWIDALNAGERVGTGIDYSAADASYLQQFEDRARESGLRDEGGGGILQSYAAYVRGATDIPSLGLQDEILGLADTVIGGGDLQQNVDYQRYIDQRDSENNPYARLGGQIAGSIIPLGRGAGVARAAGPGRAAMEGAAIGGAYGFGSGTDLQSRIGTGIIGAGTGATAGVIGNALSPYASRGIERLGDGVNALMRRARGSGATLDDDAMAVIRAGERQNIPIRQPDARPETRADFAALEASPTGNPRVTAALESDAAAVERRLGEIAPGVPQDNFGTGEMVQNAVARHRQVSREQATALYGRVDQLAPDARIPPRETLRAVRDAVADIRRGGRGATSQAEENIVQEIGQVFADSGITVGTVQAARKRIRGLVNQSNIDASATEARLLRVVQTAADELEAGLAQTNPQAAGALRTANQHYRDYIEFRDQVGRIFTGPANNPIAPEMAANRLLSMVTGKGDSSRFSRIYQQLEPAERTDLAATIVQNLGTGRTGEFSLAALATNTSRANQRALREALGSDGFRALQDLRVIARAKADTAANLNNSRTGVVSARSQLQDMVAGGLGAGAAGIPGMVIGFGVRRGAEGVMNARTARLLLNPDFTKWMRQMPDTTNPRVIQRHFDRLDRIASVNAVVAADVRSLQQYLMQAFAQSPSRAAASGQEEQDGGQIPPQP